MLYNQQIIISSIQQLSKFRTAIIQTGTYFAYRIY